MIGRYWFADELVGGGRISGYAEVAADNKRKADEQRKADLEKKEQDRVDALKKSIAGSTKTDLYINDSKVLIDKNQDYARIIDKNKDEFAKLTYGKAKLDKEHLVNTGEGGEAEAKGDSVNPNQKLEHIEISRSSATNGVDFSKHTIKQNGNLIEVAVIYEKNVEASYMRNRHFAHANKLWFGHSDPTNVWLDKNGNTATPHSKGATQYTWHHREDVVKEKINGVETGRAIGTMVLVKSGVHNIIKHSGGISMSKRLGVTINDFPRKPKE